MWQKSVRVAILDTETTGLLPSDEPISVGILLLDVDPYKGLLISEVDSYRGLRYPRVDVDPRAMAKHGFSRNDLRGKEFDIERITTLLESAEVLIAHNSKFDARMMRVVMPAIVKMQWQCTLSDWPWPRLEDKKLDTVCAHFRISRPPEHDALADCRALADALFQHSGKTTRSQTYFAELLAKRTHTHEFDSQARQPRSVLVAPDRHIEIAPQRQEPTDSLPWIFFGLVLLSILAVIVWAAASQ